MVALREFFPVERVDVEASQEGADWLNKVLNCTGAILRNLPAQGAS